MGKKQDFYLHFEMNFCSSHAVHQGSPIFKLEAMNILLTVSDIRITDAYLSITMF
jgi:hypothetical protein